uniref:Uncharacterized protein n=1 Tax=Candidatus Kentrum sp. LPFa TaxID=2126335 RepID=A0A450XL06_9GAMM|nr:MAG: hypothetical protein BECKLPF1236A_GA0070988_104331 [Candidatus Kentron sp. LPFa]VFK30015.1 MAG: hypothetical protein BECKLPF1236C_GA0070990_1010014 [Candidatus Kentron sp. LPFa]
MRKIDETAFQQWQEKLRHGLSRFTDDEKYSCVAGIPGPLLEMRPCPLPREFAFGTGIRDFSPFLASMSGLELEKIRSCQQEIFQEFRLSNIIRQFQSIVPRLPDRILLLNDFLSSILHRFRGVAADRNISAFHTIRLTAHNYPLTITYPVSVISVGLLWGIFVEEEYRMPETVDHIYDFGDTSRSKIGVPGSG